MAELRAAIDELDEALVGLLAERARYIDRAAELKPSEGMQARIASRVGQVIENARRAAAEHGIDPDLVETVYRDLIDWSIRREEQVLGPSAP